MKDTEVGVSAQEIKKIKEEAKNRIKEVKSSAKKEIEQIKMNCYAALEPAKAARRIEKNKEKQERKAMESSIPKRYSIGEEIFNSVIFLVYQCPTPATSHEVAGVFLL